jgi:hypothetical protein
MEDNDKMYSLTDLNPRPETRYLQIISLGGKGDGLDVSEKIKNFYSYRELNRG